MIYSSSQGFQQDNISLKKILISGVVGVVGVTAACAYFSAQKAAEGFGGGSVHSLE